MPCAGVVCLSLVAMKRMTVEEEQSGKRLDKVLGEMLPGTSLRHRRRLCLEQRILVGGMSMPPAFKVRAGQELALVESVRPAIPEGIRVIKTENGFAALFKPSGVHSATIAGRDNASVELFLEKLLNVRGAVLLNRLDRDTSGLLLVALTSEAEEQYLRLEREGRISKTYQALVNGRLENDVVVRSRLDTDDRAVTRVLDEDDHDFRRWTEIFVQQYHPEQHATSVKAVIRKGARHQIRAHLTSLGHPIVGDELYGGGGTLRLHHHRIEFPGFKAESPSSWD